MMQTTDRLTSRHFDTRIASGLVHFGNAIDRRAAAVMSANDDLIKECRQPMTWVKTSLRPFALPEPSELRIDFVEPEGSIGTGKSSDG
jgi:hypothetical protein